MFLTIFYSQLFPSVFLNDSRDYDLVQSPILQKTLLPCFKKVHACMFSCVQLFRPQGTTETLGKDENSKIGERKLV